MPHSDALHPILDQLARQLPVTIKPETDEKQVFEFGVIKSTSTLEALRQKAAQQPQQRAAKLIGLLFAHPATELAKTEILPFLSFFHLRSSLAVDIYCMGYGADLPVDPSIDPAPVVKVDNQTWYFNVNEFNASIENIERQTRWQYSGETDLVLFNCMRLDDGSVELDLESAIVCNLEQMQKDEAFSSVRAFFNNLFVYVNDAVRNDPAWGFSDKQGAKLIKGLLKDGVLSLLPKALAKKYRQAEHFAVRNIAA